MKRFNKVLQKKKKNQDMAQEDSVLKQLRSRSQFTVGTQKQK